MHDPDLAAVFSLILPGVAQFHNGRILAAILWLIFTPGFWIGAGGLLGWIFTLISVYTGSKNTRDHPVRR
jgi:TM2 domain-containing membrane protein YozV